MRVNYRVATLMAPAALLGLVLLLAGSFYVYRMSAVTQFSTLLQTQLDALAASLTEQTTAYNLRAHSLANDSALTQAFGSSPQHSTALNEHLTKAFQEDREIQRLLLLDAQQRPVAGFEKRAGALHSLASSGSIAVTPSGLYSEGGGLRLRTTTPLTPFSSNLPSAQLVIDYDFSFFASSVDRLLPDSGLWITFLSASGTPLIRQPGADPTLLQKAFFQHQQGQSQGAWSSLFAPTPSYPGLVYRSQGDYLWVGIITQQAIEGAIARYRTLVFYILLPIFLGILAIIVFFAHRSTIRPIVHLTNAVEKKAKGEDILLDTDSSIHEIQRLHRVLARVFDAETKAKEQIQNLAYYDTLTGLANRRLFKIYLDNAIAAAQRNQQKLALLFIDLDNFKVINDHYGHHIGDRVLSEFASRVKRITRSSDMVSAMTPTESSIARLAGDEFAILLPNLDNTIATVSVAERLLESTLLPVEIDSKLLYVHASIGIATYPDDAQNGDELIRHADAAMYQAKTSGKHTYHFFSKTLSKILQRQRHVQEALRTSLLNNEFHLELQPYVEAKTFQLAGVEVFLRWNSKALGRVSPSEFVPIAESCGMMKEIDAWVISECCEMLSDWRSRGLPPVPCSVNISAGELRNQSLPTFIDACLKSYSLASSDLEIEITETKLVDHDERSMGVLERLRGLGLSLALDDFGRGFTSLNQLKAYPVHKLKIDRTFIAELDDSNEKFLIADVILMLSRSYGLTATAEGVESLHQAQYLREAGCEYLQGYYFSRPMSRDAFEKLLHQGQVKLPLPQTGSVTHFDINHRNRTK